MSLERRGARPPATLDELCVVEGLSLAELDTLLAWARTRAERIVTEIAPDSPLLHLLCDGPHAPPEVARVTAPPPTPVALPPRPAPPTPAVETQYAVVRKHRRHAVNEPVHVRYERWHQFIEFYAKDISHGGIFIQTNEPPELRSKVQLRMSLPVGNMRDLTVIGEVVHVLTEQAAFETGVPAGFGVQFVGMTAERRRLLEVVVDHARAMEEGRLEEAELACKMVDMSAASSNSSLRLSLSEVEQRRLDELQAMLDRARVAEDRALLLLPASATGEEIRSALTVATYRYRHDAYGPRIAPEIRAVARQLIVRFEDAAQNVELSLRGRTPVDGAPESRPASGPVKRLAKFLGMARTREPVQATKAPSQRIDTQTSEQAIAAINDKRYPEAIELLTELTRRHPTHKRAMVLLRLARARLWVEQREVVRAIEEYEALLEIEPNYSAATCDLALLRCLH